MTETTASTDDGTFEWRDFLTDQPPGARGRVDRGAYVTPGTTAQVKLPELFLHCDGTCKTNRYCKGNMVQGGKLFGGTEKDAGPSPARPTKPEDVPYDFLISYTCDHCYRFVKSFAVRFRSLAPSLADEFWVDVQKMGEWPSFAPRLPTTLRKLLGPDLELFTSGRRAEFEGLGIGAFAYYRRIVERSKNRFLEAIIRVARHTGTPEADIDVLEAAKKESRFSQAMKDVKEAIPKSLFIKKQNPFPLLHQILSEDLHNASDEECLRAASDLRLILGKFTERLDEVMKDEKELDDALNRLRSRNNPGTHKQS